MYKTLIDKNGFVVSVHLATDDVDVIDGQQLIDSYPKFGVGAPLKHKWDGQKWVEGATQAEINEYNASQLVEPQPNEIDILREENEQLKNSLADLWEVVLLGGAE